MSRIFAILATSLTLSAPICAHADAAHETAVPLAQRPVLHYRGLEKMLRRFRLQSGSASHEDRQVADTRTRG